VRPGQKDGPHLGYFDPLYSGFHGRIGGGESTCLVLAGSANRQHAIDTPGIEDRTAEDAHVLIKQAFPVDEVLCHKLGFGLGQVLVEGGAGRDKADEPGFHDRGLRDARVWSGSLRRKQWYSKKQSGEEKPCRVLHGLDGKQAHPPPQIPSEAQIRANLRTSKNFS
jgi:hypothetical protein